jgi:2-phosphosulfolactate phosphatase
LLGLESGARIVLPSPNGSTCSVVASELAPVVIAGSLRNASAVAAFLTHRFKGSVVSVIACGERWPDGQLRPAVEDLLGAGAILAALADQALSPEALAAAGVFQALQQKLSLVLRACSSGQELTLKGLADDVNLAAELDASTSVPVLQNGAYTGAKNPE